MPQIPQQTILISAYDFFLLKQRKEISADFIKGCFKQRFLFLDSGGYELQFADEPSWTSQAYAEVLSELNPHFYVGFDRIPSYSTISETTKEIRSSCEFLKKNNSKNGRVLLFHFSLKNTPLNEIETVTRLIQENQDVIDIIGFPERELGPNIIQACIFIKKLRERLDDLKIFRPIHIFGCSDPKSILLFIRAGADIFDGLGWIKYAFSREKLVNVERTQLPFFGCECKACVGTDWLKISNSEYEYRLLLHNLLQIEDFFGEIREAIVKGQLTRLLKKTDLLEISCDIDKKFELI